MRFETSQSTPPQLDRRVQLRMLSFVAMFAVMMFLVNILFTDPPKKQNDAAYRSAIPRRDIDFKVRDDGPRSLKSGEIALTPPDQFEAPIERSREWLDEIQRPLPVADITVLLDIAPETAVARKQTGRDRFERDLSLLARVRESYRNQATQLGWVLIDGEQEKDAVQKAVEAAVLPRLVRL